MQTFLPFASFADSVGVLDRQRLGKQRIETMQIMRTLTGYYDGRWLDNIPLSRAWRGHEDELMRYQEETIDEWTRRGYQDTCLDKTRSTYDRWRSEGHEPIGVEPLWIGDEKMHEGYRALLIRKAPHLYRELFADTDANAPFFWPGTSEPWAAVA